MNFRNNEKQDRNFKEFTLKKSLADKATFVISFNLFNNQETSNFIGKKIETLRILRNYGAHSKGINQFLEGIVTNRADSEIESVFNVIKDIKSGLKNLKSNPPAFLP